MRYAMIGMVALALGGCVGCDDGASSTGGGLGAGGAGGAAVACPDTADVRIYLPPVPGDPDPTHFTTCAVCTDKVTGADLAGCVYPESMGTQPPVAGNVTCVSKCQ